MEIGIQNGFSLKVGENHHTLGYRLSVAPNVSRAITKSAGEPQNGSASASKRKRLVRVV
jgi:hypothetical protein